MNSQMSWMFQAIRQACHGVWCHSILRAEVRCAWKDVSHIHAQLLTISRTQPDKCGSHWSGLVIDTTQRLTAGSLNLSTTFDLLTAGSLNLSTTFDLFLTDILPSSRTYMYLQQQHRAHYKYRHQRQIRQYITDIHSNFTTTNNVRKLFVANSPLNNGI